MNLLSILIILKREIYSLLLRIIFLYKNMIFFLLFKEDVFYLLFDKFNVNCYEYMKMDGFYI